MTKLRKYSQSDWPEVWRIIKPVFRAGESYAYSPDISEQAAKEIWINTPAAVYLASDATGNVLGTYYIKPNQPTLGSHVCNCGYIVAAKAQGKGIAAKMCLHSQRKALELGFSAMQYNLVAISNEGAIHLWKKHGFEIVGTLPLAFNHARLGLIDALVMYKQLN
jgi:RimJ/RimL family protein N-acetyltransferase